MRKYSGLSILLIFTIILFLISGCSDNTPEKEKFTVDFSLGYEDAVGTVPAQVIVEDGDSLGSKFPAEPSREGFTFIGWYGGAVLFSAQTPVNKSITLVAMWESPPPAEAALFDTIAPAASLKEYSHGNPIMTQNFGADPNIVVWEDRLYVYMTADELLYSGGQIIEHNYGTIRSLRVLSTDDLVNWTQHPELHRDNISGGGWISNIWAPALAVKEIDGKKKVFLYFSNSGGSVAVISADHPLGPWTSPRTNALLSGTTDVHNPSPPPVGLSAWPNVVWVFDPAVLVDDDGKAYIYFGGGTPDNGGTAADFTSAHPRPRTKRVAELGADMISIVPNTIRGIDLPFTFEASEINKINGRYYYSYSTNPQVNHYATRPHEFPEALIIGDSFAIAYAVSDNPLGPFTFQGSILHNPGKIFNMPYNNNHHKMFQFKNRWYIAYHTKILMQAIGGIDMGWNYRSTNIDAVNIRSSGRIELVTGTKTGVTQAGSINPYEPVIGATMAVMAGITTEPYNINDEQRMRVTDIHTGDWIALRGVDFGEKGAVSFRCRITPPAVKSVIQIRQGALTGAPVGYVIIEPGQSEITIDLMRTVLGVQDLVFIFQGSGYKLEEWQFYGEKPIP